MRDFLLRIKEPLNLIRVATAEVAPLVILGIALVVLNNAGVNIAVLKIIFYIAVIAEVGGGLIETFVREENGDREKEV